MIKGHDEIWKKFVMTVCFGATCLPNTVGHPLAAIVVFPFVSEV